MSSAVLKTIGAIFVAAALFLSGLYVGGKAGRLFVLDESVGWNATFTNALVTSLKYFREGNEEEGIRLMEVYADIGSRITASYSDNEALDETVRHAIDEALQNYNEYREVHPFDEFN